MKGNDKDLDVEGKISYAYKFLDDNKEEQVCEDISLYKIIEGIIQDGLNKEEDVRLGVYMAKRSADNNIETKRLMVHRAFQVWKNEKKVYLIVEEKE